MSKKNPNNKIDLEESRYGLFMNENSFDLEIEYGRHYLEKDFIQRIHLHRINILETKSHSLYSQTKPENKSYFPPIELKIMLDVDDAEQYYYGNVDAGIPRDDTGNITFGVYLKELEEKNTEINRGDVIEYNMSGEKSRFYEVESANMVEDVTSQTIGGMRPYYKKIVAIPIKSDITPYLDRYE